MQDSVVIVPKWIAIEIAKDLARLDQADSTLLLMEEELEIQVKRIGIQDRALNAQNRKIANLERIVMRKDGVIAVNEETTEHWKKQYKKQKRQKFIIGGVAIVVIALSLIGG